MSSDVTAAIGRRCQRQDQATAIPAADALALIKSAGLRHVAAAALSIRRRRCGRGWIYLRPDDRRIADHATVRRLARLAVPPAYQDVLYAEDPAAHLQAIGRDSEGRLQYRYHPRWEEVREIRKARRLARLADALPASIKASADILRHRNRPDVSPLRLSSSWSHSPPSDPVAKAMRGYAERAAQQRS
jgi:DNA topoisomerase IB